MTRPLPRTVDNILDLIGNTPMLKLRKIPDPEGAEIYVKLELLNRVDADDCIVEESEVYGTMEGPLFGVEPSGRPLRYRVVIFFPVRDGLFTGERVYFDLAEFARQVPAAQRLVFSPPPLGEGRVGAL